MKILPNVNGCLTGLTRRYPSLFSYTADTTNGPGRDIKFLFDNDIRWSLWCSANIENQSFTINVANNAWIILTNYTFQVSQYSNRYYARNWMVSCFDHEWKSLENITNNERINSNWANETFSIDNTMKCRSLNFRMIGPSASGEYNWCLTSVEIFGELVFDTEFKYIYKTCIPYNPILMNSYIFYLVFVLITEC